jgi:hypothetical protein
MEFHGLDHVEDRSRGGGGAGFVSDQRCAPIYAVAALASLRA